MLREMGEYTGLVDELTEVLLDTYKGLPVHAPGRVFTQGQFKVDAAVTGVTWL